MNSFIVLLFTFATISIKSNSQYLLPITKHEPTNQFYTTLNIGSTTKSPINLLLDLGTNLTWLNCRNIKSLSSLRLVTCQSSTCKSIPGNQCEGKSCLYKQPNPLALNPTVTSRVVQDTVSIPTTDGGKASLPRFTFSCAGDKSLKGLPPSVSGVLALSPGSTSFWRQVTSAFNVVPKFSLCLPSSGSTGHFYIAAISMPEIPMTLTLLRGTGSGDYKLYLLNIYVGGTPLKLNPGLLDTGAKFSSLVHYTVLHTDLYNALSRSFALKAKEMGISKVASVGPFKECFDGRTVGAKVTGPNVPVIEIGVPGRIGEVKWGFYGANTVVKVKENVICLAFIDGGKKTKELMVIGTHQLQDYKLEFDFTGTALAFSDPLLMHNTSCSN